MDDQENIQPNDLSQNGEDQQSEQEVGNEAALDKDQNSTVQSEDMYLEEQLRQQNDFTHIKRKLNGVVKECKKVLIDQEELIQLMLISILSDGHVLLEGVPGIAKTLSARVLAKTIDTSFSRIQFTPDLMPADIIGTSIFNMKSSEFDFKKGPIFSNVVLIDEINRAPAKTQSALFEVMGEKQISYDGTSYKMDFPFVVIATQNPIEQEGTYRLPEAQLDRFLMKISLHYPTKSGELAILKRFSKDIGVVDLDVIQHSLTRSDIKEAQEALKEIHIEDAILNYITNLIHETRSHAKVYIGASPRASLAMLRCSKVVALMEGRDFVIPEDIQYVAPYILNHRLILSPEAEMEGMTSFDVIDEIVKTLEIPR